MSAHTNPVLIAGPSPEGSSMDKLRDLANGERRHIGITDARAISDLFEGLQFRLRAMVQFYDEHVGTPCAQIRWQQDRDTINAQVDALGEALYLLSGPLAASGFLQEQAHHQAYEQVFARFQAIGAA